MPLDNPDIKKPEPVAVVDEREKFRDGLIDLTVHLFTFLFSILSIPLCVTSIVFASLNTDYLKTLGDPTK